MGRKKNMNFSIVMIVKNEEATLPRLFASLKEFKDAGGDIVIIDTGSRDNTVEIARKFGCVVEEVESKFMETVYEGLATNINDYFIIEGEEKVVKGGDRFFNFSAARNYAASLAKNDMILSLDADEVLTVFDIGKICEVIDRGYSRIEHYQVYTHEADGSEGVKFLQSKFYDRTKTKWSNYAHEMLSYTDDRAKIGEDILKIEQWQVVAEGLHTYLTGLAADVYLNQSNPRNCHYFARELFYSGRLKSALKEFERHLAMKLPPQEYPTTPTHIESMMFVSNIYGRMGMLEAELEWCDRAIALDPTRREPVVRKAHFYKWHNKPKEAKKWALKAASFDWDDRCGLSGVAFKRDPEMILRWVNSIYPMVSIIIPTLGREEKLKNLLASIKENAGYDNYEVIVEHDQFPPNNAGVPKTFKKGVEKSKGELVMYLGNDCIARKDFLKEAVDAMVKYFPALDGLVSLNDGYWYGEVATHFLAGKKLLPLIGGEFFHTGYHHTGCDSELTQMARKLGKYIFAEEARIYHDHPIQNNFKKEIDEVYKLAYNPNNRVEDNALYHEGQSFLVLSLWRILKIPSLYLARFIPSGSIRSLYQRIF
jgi:glycosyltransferase involved in cell wall biosynthesis